ncbi:major intrinsic protein [Bifidobacterium dolichotidis]|uniref:Major intrinsic protein n=1 Tax=Bifidobacterium dolichotidis TaxID=2306976 RepID=A0A430FT89_9BIFI|nr:aquaporin [Bifidobacterium dolichotidis]RSX56037.1 major intrinsic protein [Bifidobacterium dolichotidis]
MTAMTNGPMPQQQIVVEQVTRPDQKNGLHHGMWARVLAELAGSFMICFAIYMMLSFGTAFYGTDMAFVALGTGVVYAAMTFIFSKISGGQFNPAITVAAMLTNKTRVLDGILYIVAQVIGAIAAGGLFAAVVPTSQSVQATQWYSMIINGYGEGSAMATQLSQLGISFNITLAIAVELIASIIVVATAMATLRSNGAPTRMHSIAMGVAYAAATTFSYVITGASINPARATGIAIFAHGKGLTKEPLTQLWVFWVCAILAAALVALAIIIAQVINNSQNIAAQEAQIDDQMQQDEQIMDPAAPVEGDVTLREQEADLAAPDGFAASMQDPQNSENK